MAPSLSVQLSTLSRELQNLDVTRSPKQHIRDRLPRLYNHLKRVPQFPDSLDCWGQSVNEDELTHTQIVPDVAIAAISDLSGVPLEGPGYHAGLLHTYGYLLSTIKTPFGYKRDRWMKRNIERGFGLPTEFLHAFPRRGILLTNLTNFLNRLTRPKYDPTQQIGPYNGLRSLKPGSISGWILSETITHKHRQRDQKIQLQTHVLPFPFGPRSNDSHLLVYSIKQRHKVSLISAFTVTKQTASDIVKESELGINCAIKLRYNGFLPPGDHTTFDGVRELREWST